MIFGTTAFSEASFSAEAVPVISYATPDIRVTYIDTDGRVYYYGDTDNRLIYLDTDDRVYVIQSADRIAVIEATTRSVSTGSNRVTKSNIGLH